MKWFYLIIEPYPATGVWCASRIENDKSDPDLSFLARIAKTLGVSIAKLFTADDVFKDVTPLIKHSWIKYRSIELIDSKEKAAFFTMPDALVSRKKIRDNFTSALQLSA